MSQGSWDTWPNIRKAALELAYDNGMINRFNSEEEWLGAASLCLSADGVDYADLQILDNFIATLTDEQVITLVAGEHEEMQALINENCVKPEVCQLFEDIFDA